MIKKCDNCEEQAVIVIKEWDVQKYNYFCIKCYAGIKKVQITLEGGKKSIV